VTEQTRSKTQDRKFYKGEFWVREHEDWRELIRVCAARRNRMSPHLFGVSAGLSNALGEFARTDRVISKSVYVGPVLEALVFHRFQPMLMDLAYGTRYEISGNDSLRAALQAMHQARGLSADAFRKAAGNSSSMTTFTTGRSAERSANISSTALTRLLGHYEIPLVVQDQLHRSVMPRPELPN
jgi:hypothetical protein